MRGFLAAVHAMGNGLVYVQPLSRTDPGFGGGIGAPGDPGYGHPEGPGWGGPVDPGWGNEVPVDPGYGRPGWGPTDPGYGRPGGGGRPSQPIHIPAPPGVVAPPIVIPRPSLPAGSLIAVPLPPGAPRPEPKGDEPAPAPDAVPYVVWGGPGTQSKIVFLTPPPPAPGVSPS